MMSMVGRIMEYLIWREDVMQRFYNSHLSKKEIYDVIRKSALIENVLVNEIGEVVLMTTQ